MSFFLWLLAQTPPLDKSDSGLPTWAVVAIGGALLTGLAAMAKAWQADKEETKKELKEIRQKQEDDKIATEKELHQTRTELAENRKAHLTCEENNKILSISMERTNAEVAKMRAERSGAELVADRVEQSITGLGQKVLDALRSKGG